MRFLALRNSQTITVHLAVPLKFVHQSVVVCAHQPPHQVALTDNLCGSCWGEVGVERGRVGVKFIKWSRQQPFTIKCPALPRLLYTVTGCYSETEGRGANVI